MKMLKLAFKRETAIPMLALTFASCASVGLVIARIAWTGNIRYGFLIWNLFLAWMPLLFALLASDEYCSPSRRNLRIAGFGAAWFIFFPNAPYILTDLIHLTAGFYRHFWIDMVLILLCALTGLVLGFLSLYLMQSIVAHRAGKIASWGFIAGIAALSSFGIYLGRFLRFNSWDVIVKPVALARGITDWAANPLAHPTTYAFPILFATFLFVSYLMLYALTHLRPGQEQTPSTPIVGLQEA